MSELRIERNHGRADADAARVALQPMEQKLEQQYGVTLSWSGNQAEVKGKGVAGTLQVGEERVVLSLKLGLLLRPLGSKIRASIERSMDKLIG